MNKELIKKYKVEFDHWLNGGEILCASYGIDEKNYSAWHNVHHNDSWDYNNAYRLKFIINDKYVEFRKALAEGKKIEILDVDGKWKDSGINNSNSAFIYPLEDYRIKK